MTRMLNGEFPLHSQLPGRNSLLKHYDVAYGTIDRALRNLESIGMLSVRNGKGSFVSRIPSEEDIRNIGTFTGMPATPSPSMDSTLQIPRPRLVQRATIGVIGSTKPPSQGRNWTPLILHRLEGTISNANGAMRFYNRYPQDSPRSMPIEDILAQPLRDKVDAVILVGIHYPLEVAEEFVNDIGLDGPVQTCITWDNLNVSTPHCYYDNVAGGYVAGQHLIRSGYRRLVFLSTGNPRWEPERLEGMRRAVRQSTLSADALGVVEKSGAPAELDEFRQVGRDLASRVLAECSGPLQDVALIASTDRAAWGVLDILRENGLRPGEDIGVLGYDDDDPSQGLGLTSIRPPLEELADIAVTLVVGQLNNEPTPLRICSSPQLVARASTFRRD
jgi:DNA-binding LacI/PurR family transcriptional regulator